MTSLITGGHMAQNDKINDDWEAHWSNFSISAEENPAQGFRRKIIFRILKSEKKDCFSLIDFGSGQGDLIKDLSKIFHQAQMVGFELSEKGVSVSKEKAPQAVFVQKNILENDTSKEYINYADYGICAEVIEHVDDPVEFLINIKRYLKNNAKLILTVPGGKMSAFDKHIGHRKHFTANELKHMLDKAGYEECKVKTFGFPFFNIYKIISILRGNKLIDDCRKISKQNRLSILGRVFIRIFNILFVLNVDVIPFGWQLVAVARVKKGNNAL